MFRLVILLTMWAEAVPVNKAMLILKIIKVQLLTKTWALTLLEITVTIFEGVHGGQKWQSRAAPGGSQGAQGTATACTVIFFCLKHTLFLYLFQVFNYLCSVWSLHCSLFYLKNAPFCLQGHNTIYDTAQYRSFLRYFMLESL